MAVDPDKVIDYESIFCKDFQRGKITSKLALDTERVWLEDKREGLARISIVNYYGEIVYDSIVKPRGKIQHTRMKITGLTKKQLNGAPYEKKVIGEVKQIVKGRVLVGFDIGHDLEALQLTKDDYKSLVDVSEFDDFMTQSQQKKKLKTLSGEVLNALIQEGVHSSIIDARATMALYRSSEVEIDEQMKQYPPYNPYTGEEHTVKGSGFQ